MSKTKEELLSLLKSNIDSFNLYRKETNFEKINFSGSDLEGTNLCRADLENCILTDTLLGFAYLHSANLQNCDFTDLTVGRADMTESNLSGSILNGADLANTILYGANLTGIQARNTSFQGAKLREVNLSNADLTNAKLADLDLNGVNFENAILNGADFIAANLSNTLNLDLAKFDHNTMWPGASNLPDDFDPTQADHHKVHDPLEEEYSMLNADVGPGINVQQEYEFLDMPQSQSFSQDFSSESRPEEASGYSEEYSEFSEPPNFEQFTADQFQDFPTPETEINEPNEDGYIDIPEQIEPGLAAPVEDYEEETPETIDSPSEETEEDPFSSSLSSSFEAMSQSVSNGEQERSGIQKQDYPIGVSGSSFKPSQDLVKTEPSSEAALQSTQHQPNTQPTSTISTQQMQTIMDSLTFITEKLGTIEKEQQAQKEVINELKQTFSTQTPEIDITPQISNLTEETKSTISRLEAKLDILAQTDPIDVIDSMIGELEEALKADQESIEEKLSKIVRTIDKVSTLPVKGSADEQTNFDLDTTELTNNIHQMLSNLESNIREDQALADKKIDDLSTIVESLSVAIENAPVDVTKETKITLETLKEESLQRIDTLKDAISANSTQKVDQIQEYLSHVDQRVEAVRDNVLNINSTLGALVEISQDENAESQIYEAFYDFEFRLQLELEKNQTRLNSLEKLLATTNESLDKINTQSEKLNVLGELSELPKMLETFRNQIFNEIQQTEQRTDRLKEMLDDMIIQLESVFNMQLENFERSIGMEISNLSDKINDLLSKGPEETNTLTPEMGDKINTIDENVTGIIEHMTSTQTEISETKSQLIQLYEQLSNNSSLMTNTNEDLLSTKKGILSTNEDIQTINNKLTLLTTGLTELKTTLTEQKAGSTLDDETRSIIEHLLLQVNNYSSSANNFNQEITNKVTSLESNLQTTLTEMDQKILKINSMIRNVYKALDSITDLITDISKPIPSLQMPQPQERPLKKGLLSKPKEIEPAQGPRSRNLR